MLKFRCTECEQKIGVPDDWANHLVRCPRCRSAIPVPKVIDVEVKRVPVFAEPAKPVAPQPIATPRTTQARGARIAKPQAAKPAPRKRKQPSGEPIITKAPAPTDGDVFAKPPVRESENDRVPALVDQTKTVQEKSSPRPMVDSLHLPDEPGLTSSTAVADLLKSLGSESTEAQKDPTLVEAKIVVPAKPRKRRQLHFRGHALAALGFFAGIGGLGLIVLPAWTKFAFPVAILGLMAAVLATVGRANRRGGEVLLAIGAFAVSGLAAVMALLVSSGILPGNATPRASAHTSNALLAERKGDVEVRLTSVSVVHPVVYASGQWKKLESKPQPLLQIDLELRELRPARRVAYRSWGRLQDGVDPPALTDNEGNPLKLQDFTPLVPVGRPHDSPAYMDGIHRGVSDVLLFEVPPAAAQGLDLQLPGANFGADGVVEFHIPSAMLRR